MRRAWGEEEVPPEAWGNSLGNGWPLGPCWFWHMECQCLTHSLSLLHPSPSHTPDFWLFCHTWVYWRLQWIYHSYVSGCWSGREFSRMNTGQGPGRVRTQAGCLQIPTSWFQSPSSGPVRRGVEGAARELWQWVLPGRLKMLLAGLFESWFLFLNSLLIFLK